MSKTIQKINPFDLDVQDLEDASDCLDEREPINPFKGKKLCTNSYLKDAQSQSLSKVGSTLPSYEDIETVKEKLGVTEKKTKSQFNPFFEVTAEKTDDEPEFIDSPKCTSAIIEDPPKYSENRQRYTGSPDFALVRPRKILKRVPNKILCIAENPLLKGKDKQNTSDDENEHEIPINGVKGDITNLE